MLSKTPRWLGSASIILLLSCPSLALAQNIFSPGPLAAPHANLEGLENCLKCHASGKEVSKSQCLSCHKEIATSIAAKTGLHGHLKPAELGCETCHREHLGVKHSLLPWRQDKKDFDHRTTGFPLRGAHATTTCNACHDNRLIQDPTALKRLSEFPTHATFMGLPTACASCHFDAHRGQEGNRCQTCHTENAWTPAPGFNHNKTDYPLTGAHTQVKCAACHATLEDTRTPADAFPAPTGRTYLKYKPVASSSCSDCHQDPHKGAFGSRCASCHTTRSWHSLTLQAPDTGFHDHTRYPLRGEHVGVPCRSCHGPSPGQAAVFRGLRFDTCAACHVDAHEGQLTVAPRKGPTPPCETCHTVQGFMPPRFDQQEHAATRYPLVGAHQTTACRACHALDPSLEARVAPAVRAQLARKGRPALFSRARLSFEAPLNRCDSCHTDPHAGQFAARVAKSGCVDCHREDSFEQVKFDHETESTYPLTGAHAKVPCAGCHKPGHVQGHADPVVVYKPLDTRCATCHADIHFGQFAKGAKLHNACETCHTTGDFKQTLFAHDNPTFTTFALDGKHQRVACNACHALVPLGGNTDVRRYKPVPRDCESCHQDYHRGRLQRMPQWLDNAWQRPAATSQGTRCTQCHTAAGWLPAAFDDHDHTAMPLRGAHRSATCVNCHLTNMEASVSTLCASCHRDAHAGELGTHCASCHTEENWQSQFDATAHRRTNFPLIGAHGAIPCEQCHLGAFDRNFRGTTLSCEACHQKDYLLAGTVSINHVLSGFGTDCRSCHDTWSFATARFVAHDQCFQLSGGPHDAIACKDCHTSLRTAVANGACATGTATCTACHTHQRDATDHKHTSVPGYQYSARKCYECHRFSDKQ